MHVTKADAITERLFHLGDCKRTVGARGGVYTTITEVRRSGKTQTWKTRPSEYKIPVKYGLYQSSYIYEDTDAHCSKDCPLLLQATLTTISNLAKIDQYIADTGLIL